MGLSKSGYPVPLAKRCSKCRATMANTDFSRKAPSPDGLQSTCRRCARRGTRVWRSVNPDYNREYHAANRAHRSISNERWYAENRDYKQAYGRDRAKQWRAANPGYAKEYRDRNRDRKYALQAQYRARKNSANHVPYSRAEIFARWGGMCGYGCGRPAEHLDHVTPLSRGGDDVESNVLPSCADENLSKGAKTLAEWALSWL